MDTKDWLVFLFIEAVLLGLAVLAYAYPAFGNGTCYVINIISLFVEKSYSSGVTANWCNKYAGIAVYITLMLLGVGGQILEMRRRRIQEERARKSIKK